jgi:hypothetical protein
MKKRLAILAALLMAMPALAPAPGRAATPAGNDGGKANNQGQKANDGSAPSLPLGKPVTAPPQTKPADIPTADDAEHSIKLTSLPPVTLTDKNKTVWDYFFDWGPWAFGFVLAVAGVWQLLLLRVTWKTIQGQKEEMAVQTKVLQESLAAAQKAADAAEKSASAAMGVAVPTLAVYKFSFINEGRQSPEAFYQYPRIRLELRNYGQSPAFLRKYAICLSWGNEQTGKCPIYPFDEEQVIDAGATYRFTEIDLEVLDLPPQAVVGDLVRGKRGLTLAGWVSYKDIFGSPIRRLTFCKALLEYDPDPTKMVILDPSPLNMAVDPDDQ